MTDQGRPRGDAWSKTPPLAAGDGRSDKPFYSKDYWDIVFEQLGKRWLFKISMVVLALLYASAIYAPLIANDKPYVLEAIDYREYRQATNLLSATTSSMGRLLKQTPEEYLEGRNPEAPPTLQAALDVERSALALKIETMERFLPGAEHAELDTLLVDVDAALARVADGELEGAREDVDAIKKRARALKKAYKAIPPADPAAEGDDGVAAIADQDAAPPEGKQLVPEKRYPLFESLTPFNVYLMVFWAMVMLWPVWNRLVNALFCGADRERVRKARRWKAATWLFLPGAVALLWYLLIGSGGGQFDVAPYKAGLSSGDIVATSEPVFPPLAYGYAEIHSEESFRPPTWKSYAEVSEEGYYVRGYRVPEPDPVTGFMPEPTPTEVRFGEPDRNASWRHPMGTDESGRDFLVRLIWGGRVSLSVGILSAALLTLIGVIVGSLAGYFGGWVDIAIMRLIEILQSIPAFFLILVTMAFTDPKVVPPMIMIVVVIALVRWTGVARLVRGEFLRLRESEFVLAANALGFSSRRTIFRHVLPNALSPVIVNGAFSVAAGILTESAISFLGFGIQHPGASWGSLVNESRSPEHWWIQIFPGIAIFITVTCYNLAGDALRDALDPKMKD